MIDTEPVIDALGIASILVALASLLAAAVSAFASRRASLRANAAEKAVGDLRRNHDPASLLNTGTAIRLYRYLDEAEVLKLYEQTRTSDLVLAARNVETSGERQFSLSGAFKWFTPSYRRSRRQTSIDTFTRDMSADVAMPILEQRLLENGQISVIDSDSAMLEPPLRGVQRQLSILHEQTGFNATEEVMGLLESLWRKFRADQGIERLATLTGFVALDGDFLVASDASGDVTLSRKLILGDETVDVHIVCREEGLTTSGRRGFRHGSYSRVTCFGAVTNWDRDTQTLLVMPIAVF